MKCKNFTLESTLYVKPTTKAVRNCSFQLICNLSPPQSFSLKNIIFQGVFTSLDVIHTAVYYAAHRKLRDSETLALVETAIYCATVDQRDQVLKVVVQSHA